MLLCLFSYRVRTTVIDVEYPLIRSQLKQLDSVLEKAISQLNWTSNGKATLALKQLLVIFN